MCKGVCRYLRLISPDNVEGSLCSQRADSINVCQTPSVQVVSFFSLSLLMQWDALVSYRHQG